jgi:hypothetical protein
MTARVLADYFDRVTVFERDQIEDRPAIHKSIPQGNHVHTLLLGGQQVMSTFFPGFTEELKRSDAVPFRSGIDAAWYGPDGKGYNPTGSVREPRDPGFESHTLSRGLLEHLIRQRTAALANVKIETGVAIEGLVHDNPQVRGVRCGRAAGSQSVEADLVVDAGGRSSHAPRWLARMGMLTPEETTIGVDFAYTSTKFRKTPRPGTVDLRRWAAAQHPRRSDFRDRGQYLACKLGRSFRGLPSNRRRGLSCLRQGVA